MSIGQGRLECAHEHAKNIRFGDHADDGAVLNHRQTAYTMHQHHAGGLADGRPRADGKDGSAHHFGDGQLFQQRGDLLFAERRRVGRFCRPQVSQRDNPHEPVVLNWWQTFCSAAVGANATPAAGLRYSGFSKRARELERPRETESVSGSWIGVAGSDVKTSAKLEHSCVR